MDRWWGPWARRVIRAPPGFPRSLVRKLPLLDGRRVFVRPVLPGDQDALRRAIELADADTLHRRFLGGRPPLRDRELQRLVCVDYDRRFAVVAFARNGNGVGIARYEALEGTDTAEVAVAVDPEWRHVGLATALVQLLGVNASQHGIDRFTADFFADNVDVVDLLVDASLPYQSSEDSSGVVTAQVELPSDRSLEP
jgi:GNAT superfamily N-acetyltransferase